MSERLSDHDLTVMVESAAQGVIDSETRTVAPSWSDLDGAGKNAVRELALPFIFHGTKALSELGYVKPRTVTTVEELDALPNWTVVLSEEYLTANGDRVSFQRWYDGYWYRGGRSSFTDTEAIVPATVLWEPR